MHRRDPLREKNELSLKSYAGTAMINLTHLQKCSFQESPVLVTLTWCLLLIHFLFCICAKKNQTHWLKAIQRKSVLLLLA